MADRLAMTNGPLIGVISSDSPRAKEGSLTAGWL